MEETVNAYVNEPIELSEARAWRTYLGGKLLEEFYGNSEGQDGHFPEAWIASVVEARNAGREQIREGLSMLTQEPKCSLKDLIEAAPEKFLGANHAKRFGATPGVLVKLIDAAERLTVQVHPDRETAKRLFQSEFGKTECWYILGGRQDGNEPPCVYLGFRPDVTEEKWKKCFENQDIPGMLDCLHKFEVHPGDVVLIEGGVPHAIGAGCFLMEIQEPTDYTIRVERVTPSGDKVSDQMCHQGLGFEVMFDCFHYEALERDEVKSRWFIQGCPIKKDEENEVRNLIGKEHTSCFSMNLLTLRADFRQSLDRFSVLYVLEGSGLLESEKEKIELKVGQSFFFPQELKYVRWRPKEGETLKLLQCFGPQIEENI